MYNNLLKSGNIVKNNETRVIDSNEKIAERLRYLAEFMELETQDEYSDGFTVGLDADTVEQLLDDKDGENPNVFTDGNTINEAEIAKLLEDAKLKAQALVDDAGLQAEDILNKARSEAESLKEEARTNGYQEGYNAGYEEGVHASDEKQAEFLKKQADLENYYKQKIEELEPQFVDKITDIYEHVFMVDLADKKELIHYLLTDAMQNIEGGRNFFVHVSKADFEYVTEHRSELMQGLPGSSTLEVIEDISLTQSQCFIEAESGIFDCGLGTELALLKKELKLLSYKENK